MPRDRRPNKTPSSAAIVEASKLQTINAFEENKMMNILKSYNIKRYYKDNYPFFNFIKH